MVDSTEENPAVKVALSITEKMQVTMMQINDAFAGEGCAGRKSKALLTFPLYAI